MPQRPHFIFSLDLRGRVIHCNLIHPEYTPESVLGHRFSEFLAERCHSCVEQSIALARLGQTAIACPLWNAPERPCTLHTTFSPWAGGVICAASVQVLTACPARACGGTS